MTDDIVARLREMPKSLDDAMRKMDKAADTIEAERAAWVKAENESRGDWASQRENDHLTIKFYEMKERAEAAEARARELEAQLTDQRTISKYNREQAEKAERALAEAYERAAKVADQAMLSFTDLTENKKVSASESALETAIICAKAAREIADAIRNLAQEVKHEAE